MEAPELVNVLARQRIAVLTGAGLSTDSGIPDYRGPDSPPSNPMTIGQFISDAAFRQRYWARNHVGWRHMDATLPNAGHRALATLEHAGVVTGADHPERRPAAHEGGQPNGDRPARHVRPGGVPGVRAHDDARGTGRAAGDAQPRLRRAGRKVGGIAVAPDADAMVTETSTFRYVDCPRCGGMLKPDIVYFGESVPKERVAQAYSLVDAADALLVAGSSLTVFSGLRFVRHAAAKGKPVAIVNRGPTRGDALAGVKVHGGCSELLTLLADELTPLAAR